jgi:PAS domain S-box-containing protein
MKYFYVFLAGLLFPLFSVLYLSGFDLSTINIIKIHQSNHLLFIIDTAPFVITSIVMVSDYIYFKKLSSFRFTRILHKKIVSNSFDAIIVANENGIIRYVNESMLNMFGFEEIDLINQNLTLIMPKKHVENHNLGMENHLKHGTSNVIGKGVVKLEGKKKNGEIFPINLLLSSFEFKKKIYFSGVITDISKEVELEKERSELFENIKNQKAFYEDVLNTIPVDIAVFDDNHKYKFVNPSGIKNAQYRKLIIGKDDFEYAKSLGRDAKTAEFRRSQFIKAKDSQKTVEWRDEMQLSENEVKTVLRKMFPVFNNEKLKMVIGFGLDISDSISKDQQIESLSRFPKENPNVIVRYDFNKKLLYINDSGINYFNNKEFNKEEFFNKLNYYLDQSIEDQSNLRVDINFGDQIFDVEIVPIFSEKYINIYAVNVTDYRLRINKQQSKLIELANKLKGYNTMLEAKVEERTQSLKEINEEVQSSIKYARRLQDAVIAHQNIPSSDFIESFVVYQPKEIVGGDFYFTYEINKHKIFGVADCTGHGIPGAMLTLMCMTFLDYAINHFMLVQPKDILGKVTELISNSFKAKGQEVKDGMDVALLSWDSVSNKVLFSGANAKVLYFKGDEKIIIKGDSRPVGNWINEEINFTQEEIDINKNDQIFMFSDGLPDQFGGEKGKKLKYPKFYSLLEEVKDLSPKDKRIQIINYAKEWIGDNEQIDDITIAGVKF